MRWTWPHLYSLAKRPTRRKRLETAWDRYSAEIKSELGYEPNPLYRKTADPYRLPVIDAETKARNAKSMDDLQSQAAFISTHLEKPAVETPTSYAENLAEARGASLERETRETRFLAYWRSRPLDSIADVAKAFEQFEKPTIFHLRGYSKKLDPCHSSETMLMSKGSRDEIELAFLAAYRSGEYHTLFVVENSE